MGVVIPPSGLGSSLNLESSAAWGSGTGSWHTHSCGQSGGATLLAAGKRPLTSHDDLDTGEKVVLMQGVCGD